LATELDPLLLAIYEDPASDEKRAVYADALVERGEPLGEVIHLQLGKATPKAKKRLKELFDPAAWRAIHPIGAIAGAALQPGDVERGFPWRLAVVVEQSALDGWRPHAGHPGWSTVRSISAHDHDVIGEIIARSRMPLLEEVGAVGPKILEAIAQASPPLTSLHAVVPAGGPLPVLSGLRRLKTLMLGIQATASVAIERARALGVLDRIEELTLWCDSHPTELVAASEALPANVKRVRADWAIVTRAPEPALEVVIDRWAVEPVAVLLESLPAKRFARVRVEFAKKGSFSKRDRPGLAARIREATKHFPKRELVLGD
jgi:uncharacterized protein (TIGR02996 family)